MTSSSRPLYEKLLASGIPAPPVRPARPSASVVPWRDGAKNGIEVYWVRRSPELAFMGGWHAFPGGRLSRRDAGIPFVGEARLPAGSFTPPLPGPAGASREELGDDVLPGLLVCALRELFEEVGLLLTSGPQDAKDDATKDLGEMQRRLLAEEADFAALLAEAGLELDVSRLVFAGRWMTPPLAPLRFDNRFFLLRWEAGEEVQPVVLPGELAEGEWIRAADALARWESAEVITAPPIVHILRVLAEDGAEGGLPRLLDPSEANLGPMRRVEFRPGVILVPLRTATLPPATHTNAFLLGRREVVLVDPAPDEAAEIAVLGEVLDAARAQGRTVRAIWLTHHHADHVGAVAAMREKLGVDVLAHEQTAARLRERGLPVDGTLADGERVVLADDFPVRVLHTPGHTRGHLAFYDETFGSLLIGDLISGLGTIVVDPPEGDMDEYLASLERMIELAPRTVFPAHGPVQLHGVGKLRQTRDHRLWRESKILAAREEGKTSTADLLAAAYDDVPAAMHPIAERQLLAHLERLRRLGKVS